MTEIFAVIRPGKDRDTKKALSKLGCLAMTTTRAHGRGKQRGLRYSTASNVAGTPQFVMMRYLPKKILYLVVNDAIAKAATQIIIRVNQTGQPGDGKIFVSKINEACRIRTDERGEAALK